MYCNILHRSWQASQVQTFIEGHGNDRVQNVSHLQSTHGCNTSYLHWGTMVQVCAKLWECEVPTSTPADLALNNNVCRRTWNASWDDPAQRWIFRALSWHWRIPGILFSWKSHPSPCCSVTRCAPHFTAWLAPYSFKQWGKAKWWGLSDKCGEGPLTLTCLTDIHRPWAERGAS